MQCRNDIVVNMIIMNYTPVFVFMLWCYATLRSILHYHELFYIPVMVKGH